MDVDKIIEDKIEEIVDEHGLEAHELSDSADEKSEIDEMIEDAMEKLIDEKRES